MASYLRSYLSILAGVGEVKTTEQLQFFARDNSWATEQPYLPTREELETGELLNGLVLTITNGR